MLQTDNELWLLCIAGNMSAFKEIYCRYYSLMFNYGMKLVPKKEFIEDCIQDLFIKLINNHKTISETSYIRSYLIKSMRNKIIDAINAQRISLEITEYEDIFIADDLFSNLFSDDITDKIQLIKVKKAYNELPHNQQEIIYLYYISELSHKEIANILGINYQSSKNLLSKSVIKFRRLFFKL